MAEPVTVDIPHKLGKEAARARLAAGVGKIGSMVPGGGTVQERWDGDTLYFTVSAMGQAVASKLDIFEDRVHAVVDLPPMLALFASKIREKLLSEGPKLLK